eukprot:gene11488-biopygen7691
MRFLYQLPRDLVSPSWQGRSRESENYSPWWQYDYGDSRSFCEKTSGGRATADGQCVPLPRSTKVGVADLPRLHENTEGCPKACRLAEPTAGRRGGRAEPSRVNAARLIGRAEPSRTRRAQPPPRRGGVPSPACRRAGQACAACRARLLNQLVRPAQRTQVQLAGRAERADPGVPARRARARACPIGRAQCSPEKEGVPSRAGHAGFPEPGRAEPSRESVPARSARP